MAPLSTRMIELTIRRARNAADILKPVTAMTLRHSYAVHCLENGASIRDLQHALGHEHIKDGRKIFRPFNPRCTLPPNLESPLDPIKRQQRTDTPSSSLRSQVSSLIPFPAPIPPFQLSAFSVSAFTQFSPETPAALDLPFTEPSADLASRFYRMLKTLIS